MRPRRTHYLLSLAALPAVALAAFLSAQSDIAIRGDVNNDGQVTTLDALAVMSHVVGKTLPPGYTMVPNGDANGDGQVTAADALVILSYVVGKDVSQFPVGKVVVTLSVTPTSATVARGETRQLSASVSGASNTAVTWRTSAESVAAVSRTGMVTGVAPGEATITVISQADTLARATARLTVTQAAASNLLIFSGNAQQATVGTQLPNALVVRVTDAAGNAVSGTTVTWAVGSGGGSITPQTSTTDVNGQAVATWTVGTAAGANTASAAGAGSTVEFSATALAGTPAKLEQVAGDAQTGTTGHALPDSLVVRVMDRYGNSTGSIPITWTVTAGGGSASPANTSADAQGLAKAQWTLGSTAGSNALTATAEGLPAMDFTAIGVAGAAANLQKVSGDDQTSTVGSALPNPLVVRLTDSAGNPVSGSSVTFSVAGGGGSVTPGSATTDAQGTAMATWTLGTRAGDNVAHAYDGSRWVSFRATAEPGPVSRIVLQPDRVAVGLQGKTRIRAVFYDQYDNQALAPEVSWSISDAAVAVIDSAGVLKGVGVGTASATIHTEIGSATAQVTVDLRVNDWGEPSLSPPVLESFLGIGGSSAADVYAVGGAGLMFHSTGGGFTQISSGTGANLFDVWGTSPTNVYAVGSWGTVRQFNGSAWSGMTSGTTRTLRAVAGSSPTNVIAVGDSGTIVRYDGERWTVLPTGTTAHLRAVWSGSDSEAYAVGSGGTILRYDGASWTTVASGTTETLLSVNAATEGGLVAVGNGGAVLRKTGSSWTNVGVSAPWGFIDAWATSGSNVYGAGNFAVYYFNGTEWSQTYTLPSPTNRQRFEFRAIWGTSIDEVYAPGYFVSTQFGASVRARLWKGSR